MGFRFRRRIGLLPGVRLNVGKTGVSTSIGERGAWLTFRRGHKVRATVGLPGTGLSYTQGGESAQTPAERVAQSNRGAGLGWLWLLVLLAIVAAVLCAVNRR